MLQGNRAKYCKYNKIYTFLLQNYKNLKKICLKSKFYDIEYLPER